MWFWGDTFNDPYVHTECLGLKGSPLVLQINLHIGDKATHSEGPTHIS